ncbi:ankyrin repeat domain-containing protein [Novosphingobium album (ex Liu et al. 2023)]|uniref:Ankyrin repeat domain-containing protein n=1 Tax=Novosphingobium album (ex Liu et al. 2023) TaxID=3031130 RepID=A0ABT5WWC4_9SPHN|nr:ankyrin repeat domain-containing protein [Novosphingobium album (ex Liu et al. 2023)]MDE8654204.1 ankyrin repeat domain-containing protein [Novosphingobium album (ex Liu et al. 2023)]
MKMAPCPQCSGIGRSTKSEALCTLCYGTGRVESPERYENSPFPLVPSIFDYFSSNTVYLSWRLYNTFRRIIRILSSKPEVSFEQFIDSASYGDAVVVERYISSNGDVNRQVDDDIGLTALHHAIGSRAYQVVELLLSHPQIDLTIRDRLGRLPSDVAFKVAQDGALGDRLIELEAEQRHVRGIPFRPDLQP